MEVMLGAAGSNLFNRADTRVHPAAAAVVGSGKESDLILRRKGFDALLTPFPTLVHTAVVKVEKLDEHRQVHVLPHVIGEPLDPGAACELCVFRVEIGLVDLRKARSHPPLFQTFDEGRLHLEAADREIEGLCAAGDVGALHGCSLHPVAEEVVAHHFREDDCLSKLLVNLEEVTDVLPGSMVHG